MDLDGHALAMVGRCYDVDTWVSVSLDIEEEHFDELGERLGRSVLVERMVALAVVLVDTLKLSYLFFEEEIDADFPPDSPDIEAIGGITVLPAGSHSAKRAARRTDVQRIESRGASLVFWRRFDPLPHYP